MGSGFRRGLRRVLVVVALFAILAAAAGAWLWQRHAQFVERPIAGLEAGDRVLVEAGDSFATVLRKLRAAGVESGHDLDWRLLARRMGVAGRLKVGEYALDPGLTPETLLQRMAEGRIVQYRFTLVEGWNFRQLRAALDAADPLLHETPGWDDAAIMEKLGHPGQHPEGRFLPETYLYQRGDSDLDLLRRAYAALEEALAQAWAARSAATAVETPEQALVLASIIEKETGLASERPLIAGVFSRRLREGWRLQTDPTVIYGMGSAYDGNIRKRDLLTDTPYNTYLRTGLTPTPIAMPSRASLRAAVDPAEGDAMYFVALGDGSGGHAFSATHAEHNAAVARYLRRLREASRPAAEEAAEEAAALPPAEPLPALPSEAPPSEPAAPPAAETRAREDAP